MKNKQRRIILHNEELTAITVSLDSEWANQDNDTQNLFHIIVDRIRPYKITKGTEVKYRPVATVEFKQWRNSQTKDLEKHEHCSMTNYDLKEFHNMEELILKTVDDVIKKTKEKNGKTAIGDES